MVPDSAAFRADLTCNGATQDIPIEWKFLDDSHLKVMLTPIATGLPTTLALGSDYTVTGAGVEAGGNVHTNVAYSSAYRISVVPDIPFDQQVLYTEGEKFPAKSHEGGLDKLTLMLRQLKETVNRCVRGGENTSVSYELPPPEVGKALGWATPTTLGNVASSQVEFAADLANTDDESKGDNMLGVKQPVAGGVARRQHNKNMETISVLDFGAKGDGITDDTSAIQAAITWAVAQLRGACLYFPSGVYNVSSVIDIPLVTSFCLMIRGDGYASQIRSVSGSISLFYIHAATAQAGAYYTIRDMAFVMNAGGGSTGTGISTLNANSIKIENCWFFNQASGVVLNASYAPIINKCYFYGCASYGVTTFTTGTNGMVVGECVFASCGTGVKLTDGGNNIVIRDSDFEANATAVGMAGYTSVQIRGNYIENGTSSVFVFTGTNRQIDIEQNWFGANGATTSFANVIGGWFRGNTLYAGSAQSCVFSNTATDFIVGSNYSYGAGTVTPPTTAWTAPSLNANFSNQGGSFVTAGYVRDHEGFVMLRGNLLFTAAPGAAAFNLPVGYRPAAYHTFVCGSSAAPGTSLIEVRTNGDVWVLAKDGSNGVGLNGIRFQGA